MSSNADDIREKASDGVVEMPMTAVTPPQESNIASGLIAVGNDALTGRRPTEKDDVVHGDEEPT
jgi:hypothetical protein